MTQPIAEYPKLGWKVREWSRAVGISRSKTWLLVTSKRIRSVKVDTSRIILTSPDDFFRALEAEPPVPKHRGRKRKKVTG
jgi:hypothetical protein